MKPRTNNISVVRESYNNSRTIGSRAAAMYFPCQYSRSHLLTVRIVSTGNTPVSDEYCSANTHAPTVGMTQVESYSVNGRSISPTRKIV